MQLLCFGKGDAPNGAPGVDLQGERFAAQLEGHEVFHIEPKGYAVRGA